MKDGLQANRLKSESSSKECVQVISTGYRERVKLFFNIVYIFITAQTERTLEEKLSPFIRLNLKTGG